MFGNKIRRLVADLIYSNMAAAYALNQIASIATEVNIQTIARRGIEEMNTLRKETS